MDTASYAFGDARKDIRSYKNVAQTLPDGTIKTPPAMVKDKSGEGGQTAVGLDPINEGVQPDVQQRDRSGIACQRNKSHDVRAATWNASSMVDRSGEVVDARHRRNMEFCCAQDTRR